MKTLPEIPKSEPGFTLIEIVLTLVFATFILSILILITKPVEFLKISRDTERRKDLETLNAAIESYMVSQAKPLYVPGYSPDLPALPDNPPFIPLDQISNCKASINCCTVSDIRHSGWLAPIDPDDPFSCPSGPDFPSWAVDLSQYLKELPLDPINNDIYHYRYQSNEQGNKYSITAKYESASYDAKCYQIGTFIPKTYCWGP